MRIRRGSLSRGLVELVVGSCDEGGLASGGWLRALSRPLLLCTVFCSGPCALCIVQGVLCIACIVPYSFCVLPLVCSARPCPCACAGWYLCVLCSVLLPFNTVVCIVCSIQSLCVLWVVCFSAQTCAFSTMQGFFFYVMHILTPENWQIFGQSNECQSGIQ